MAKTTALSADLMDSPTAEALLPRAITKAPKRQEQATPKNDALVQIRCSKADAKAIRRDAVDAEMNISQYMLACYYAYKQR